MPIAPSPLAGVVDTCVSPMAGTRGRHIRGLLSREFAPFVVQTVAVAACHAPAGDVEALVAPSRGKA